jgi:ribosomal protein L3 glutamine methyltransferase
LGAQVSKQATVEQLIRQGASLLEEATLCFGHGTDNPFDEAAELVFFSLGLRHEDATTAYSQRVAAERCEQALALVRQRIERRVPAAYLTNRMWFCGHEFYVDERVLVPRSPLAELIAAQFKPWIKPGLIERVLDIGTGSGCIAIATALALPNAQVDAADISADALAVARVNIERHGVADRVRAVQADVYDGLADERYNVIVSNPPYVSQAEVDTLPDEYRHEPQLGLLAGADGLSVVRRILAAAESHLTASGILVVEVGDTDETVQRVYPRVPFTWLEFAHGGGGVFLLTAEQLAHARDSLR